MRSPHQQLIDDIRNGLNRELWPTPDQAEALRMAIKDRTERTFTKEESDRLVREWIADLRSGQFSQTRERLEDERGDCCLGVLCRTFDRLFPGILTISRPSHGTIEFDGRSTVLPYLVQRAARLSSDQGGYLQGRCLSLSLMNDRGGMSFGAIASLIESKPEGLFTEKLDLTPQ